MLPASIYAAAPRFAPQPALLALTVGIVVQTATWATSSAHPCWAPGWSNGLVELTGAVRAIACGGLAVALAIRGLTPVEKQYRSAPIA